MDDNNGTGASIDWLHSSNDDSMAISSGAGSIQAGQWYHVTAVFDSTNPTEPMRLYLNSLKVAAGGTTALNFEDNTAPVGIGMIRRPAGTNGQYLDGIIDELIITDTVMLP